jgi:hypothetical protein
MRKNQFINLASNDIDRPIYRIVSCERFLQILGDRENGLVHRVGYGLTEIAFGCVGGIKAAGHIASADSLFPALVALLGCVYVVVRG